MKYFIGSDVDDLIFGSDEYTVSDR